MRNIIKIFSISILLLILFLGIVYYSNKNIVAACQPADIEKYIAGNYYKDLKPLATEYFNAMNSDQKLAEAQKIGKTYAEKLIDIELSSCGSWSLVKPIPEINSFDVKPIADEENTFLYEFKYTIFGVSSISMVENLEKKGGLISTWGPTKTVKYINRYIILRNSNDAWSVKSYGFRY